MVNYLPLSLLPVAEQAECRALAIKIEDVHLCRLDKPVSQPVNQPANRSANQSVNNQSTGQLILQESLSTCLTKLKQAKPSDSKEVWLSCIKLIFDGPPDPKKPNDSQLISSANKQSKFFATYGHTLAGEPPSTKSATANSPPVNQWTQPKSKARKPGQKQVQSSTTNQSIIQSVGFSYGGSCAQVDAASISTVSTCLIDLLNEFNDKGGYEDLLDLITINQTSKSSNKPSLSVLISVLRVLVSHSAHWIEEFNQSFVPDFTERVRLLLSSYTETDYKSFTKQKFDNLFSLWFEIVGHSEPLASIVWESKLELSWVFLQGEVFDRRLIAMSTLNEACEAVNQSQSNQSVPASHTMQPDQLLSFLKRHDILTFLLSIKTSHPELLRRSQSLLSFAHQAGRLTDAHYLLLIDWLSTDLEHTLSIAQTIFLNLTSMFEFNLNHNLYVQINERLFKQPAAISVSTLQFMYAFSTRTLQNHLQSSTQLPSNMPDGEWVGLITFWTLLDLPSHHSIKPVIRSTCLSLLQAMLRLPVCDSQRDYYAIKCINQIKSGNNVSDALNILQSIVLSFPAMAGQRVEPLHHGSQCEYVLWLERQYSLTRVVIESAGREKLRTQLPNHDVEMEEIRSSHTQLNNQSSLLQVHLTFLSNCFSVSTLTLDVKQASRLWTDHFTISNTPSARQALVIFLHSLLSHRAKINAPRGQIGHCVANETCAYLLNECLCRAPTQLCDRQTFATFELYFLHVNAQQNLLTSADVRSCSVTSWSLHGLDELWSFLVASRDTSVVDAAASLLLRIYQFKSPISNIGASDFIKRCISHMGSAAQSSASFSAAQIYSPKTPEQSPSIQHEDEDADGWAPSSPDSGRHRRVTSLSDFDPTSGMWPSQQDHSTADDEDESARNERTSRCLKLLAEFIRGPKVHSVNQPSDNNPNDAWQVSIQWKPTSQPAYTKSLPTSMSSRSTIADVRNHAMTLLSHPAEFIDLKGTATTHFNNIIIDPTVVIATIPTQNQTRSLTLTAVKRPVPDELSPSITASPDSSASILAQNSSYYQKLFELLDLRHLPSIIQPAFSLLQELPVNQSLFKSIVNSSLPWKRLLPFHSPLKLLHTLGIIVDIAQPRQFESETLTQLRTNWLTNFVESGGLAHIRDILLLGLAVEACPVQTWMLAMRLKTFGVIIDLLIIICERFPQHIDGLVLPSQMLLESRARQMHQMDNYVHLGKRLMHLISEVTHNVTAMSIFEGCSKDLVNDCFVSTLNQAFKLINLLLSTSSNQSNSPTTNQAFKIERSELWEAMYSSTFEELIIETMLHGRYAPIRKAFSTNLIDFIVANQPINQPAKESTIFHHYSKLLLGALSNHSSISQSINSGEFFALLQQILDLSVKLNVPVVNQSNSSQMIQLIMSLIECQPSIESRSKRCDSLKGILGFTQALYRCEPSLQSNPQSLRLINLIYLQCLFAVDLHTIELTAKARHPETRSQAFSTLLAICMRHPANLHALMTLIYHTQLFSQVNSQLATQPWEMEMNAGPKASFVGLKNLGNTCYLNSLVQQLAMLPGFAESVLATPALSLKQTSPQSHDPSEFSGDQLYELQSLFLSLVLSKAQAVIPQPFINQFRFFGESIDTNQQYDVQEFASALFDRVDESLKLTNQAELLKSTFGGVLNNQIVGLSTCPHKHERAEPFYVLSLNIQHHNDIRQSLHEFIKGEKLTGDNAYFCSNCAAKVDAERRSLIDQVPNQLILHLKRFEFDYDTMRKRKLNTACAFPPVLDMSKFSNRSANPSSDSSDDESLEPGAPDTETENSDLFDLVGVIVHSGHADGGHYYSFVKDRFGQASNQLNNPLNNPLNQSNTQSNYQRNQQKINPSNKWFQFNDQRVSVFSFDDLALECYGGNESVKVGEDYVEIEKQRSAYMLFYERRQKVYQSNKSSMKSLPALMRSTSAAAPGVTAAIAPATLPSYLHVLWHSINISNLQLVNQQLANDPLYIQFLFRAFLHVQIIMMKNETYPKSSMRDLDYFDHQQSNHQPSDQSDSFSLVQSPPSLSLRFIQALALYVVHVLLISRPSKRLEQFVALLQHALSLHVPGCHWFIEYLVTHSDGQLLSEPNLLKRCLISCPVQSARQLMMQLIDVPIARLSVFEIDPSINPSVPLMTILEKDKERAIIESEYGSLETLPPVPPRKSISSSSNQTDTPPTTAPNSPLNNPSPAQTTTPPPEYPAVDVSLAPSQLFKVTTSVRATSPLTVLYGVSASTAKSLEKAGITNLLMLSSLSQSNAQAKQKYGIVMASTKLSPKQMTDAIGRAKEAVQFIRVMSGQDDVPPSNQTSKSTGVVADSNLVNQPSTQLVVPQHGVVRPFLTALVASLRSVVTVGDIDGSQTLETVELLNRMASRGRATIDCLIDCGVIDVLIGLCVGEVPVSSDSTSAQSTDIRTLVAGAESTPLPPLPTAAQSVNQPTNQTQNKFRASLDQTPVVNLLFTLLKHCRLPHWSAEQHSPLYIAAKISDKQLERTIPSSTYHSLISPKFIEYLVSSINQTNNQSTNPINQLVSYLCWSSVDVSSTVIECILKLLLIEDVDRATPLLIAFETLFSMNDTFSSQRMKYFVPRFMMTTKENSLCYRLTDLSLKWLFTQMNASSVLQNIAYEEWNGLEWVTTWLQSCKKTPTKQQPIFLSDGRILSLYRDLGREQDLTIGTIQLTVHDLHKAWKNLQEAATKRMMTTSGVKEQTLKR